jgi:hypothetical protein
MHPTEQKNRFIQQRAEGLSLDSISRSLQIPKSTLWIWDREEKNRIHRMKLMLQEEFEEECEVSYGARAVILYGFLDNLEKTFSENLENRARYLPLKDHFNLIKAVREELERYRVAPLPEDSNTPAEYPLQYSPENPEPITPVAAPDLIKMPAPVLSSSQDAAAPQSPILPSNYQAQEFSGNANQNS